MFVVVLPVIQLIAKNWVSRQHTDNDLKPEGVIFIVEVFNALYVSNALHNSSSWKTTATIMVIDFLHFWLSMFDVVEALNGVKILMKKIPHNHPISKENFVQIAMRLVELESMMIPPNQVNSKNMSWRSRMDAWVSSSNSRTKNSSSRTASHVTRLRSDEFSGKTWLSSNKARVFPIRPPRGRRWLQNKVQVTPTTTGKDLNVAVKPMVSLGLETIFSRKERALFVRRSARVLFITEYVVLVEYAEVVLPIVYSVHEAILYNMHNRIFYPALVDMTKAELVASVKNVLLYSSLEFVSFIMALVVLKRMLRFSTLHQLAFVLETQASMVQSKLSTLFIYVMQVPLAHLVCMDSQLIKVKTLKL
ncbi:Hypothetical protein PHPALM_16010 [Phytophthora palmivora]|uniref:Uncharacterized protein n=1 Tax=Phytophthora palmivora TaxID=4796 RepID=A0A2P4XQX4_9STRA|nr:Hypothetical protein PHPALM_16010 [Phytophthora palmivora]